MQTFTLSALAEKFGLTLQGEDSPLTGLNTLEQACETEVSFLANPKYAPLLATTKALAVIVDAEHAPQVKTALISKHPYLDFAQIASLFVRPPSAFAGVSEKAFIHPTAQIGQGCTIYPFCYVGAQTVVGTGTTLYPGVFIGDDCQIGEQCIFYPQATVLAGLTIGNNCTLQAGSVLGTEGFGFVRFAGSMQKIPQIGSVHLGDNVDVGANTCIDRATLNATRVGDDTKIDNLVQLGHNVTIGEQGLIISQVGIAGSTHVGNRVTLAGQAGIAGHLSIGDDAVVGPRAGVGKNVPAGMQGAGAPFMEGSTFLRHMILQPKVPELFNRVKKLEKELKELINLLANEKKKDKK